MNILIVIGVFIILYSIVSIGLEKSERDNQILPGLEDKQ